MLSLNKQSLRDQIIFLLGLEPNLRAKKLLALVCQRSGESFSLQAMHKQLRILLSEGIVIREAMNYRLDISWLSEIESFTSLAFKSLSARTILPNPNKKSIFAFSNPEVLLQWMTDTVIHCLRVTRATQAFEYCPSMWQGLLNIPNEMRFWKQIESSKVSYRIFVGTISKLDREYLNLVSNPGVITLGKRSRIIPPFSHMIVVPPFIIKIQFGAQHLRLIRKIFSTSPLSQVELIRLVGEFKSHRAPIRVQVHNSDKKAARFWNSFMS